MAAENLSPDFDEPPSTESDGAEVLLPVTTLAGRFAHRHGCTLAESHRELFRQSLYPAARWLRPLLSLVRGHFDVDERFIRAVGRATALTDVQTEVRHFADDQGHRGVLRGFFRLRVSVRRLRQIAREFLPETGVVVSGNSVAPFLSRSGAGSAADLPVTAPGWNGGERRVLPSRPLPKPAPAPADAETVRRLEAEVTRLKAQREILTQAVGIIARQSSDGHAAH